MDGKCVFLGSAELREISSVPEKPLGLRALRKAHSRACDGNSGSYWMETSFLDALRPAGDE
jgi:hypothetical protein